MTDRPKEVAIVGAGILGLAHAWLLARSGARVTVFERSPRAMGASVRNFGMVWPIGQPAGPMLEMALRSRQLWLEVLGKARLSCRDTGSLHAAYRPDEAEVLREFSEAGPGLGYKCRWIDRDCALGTSGALRPEGLLGALSSSTELTVDPRQVLAALPELLQAEYGVAFEFSTPVLAAGTGRITTAKGSRGTDAILITGGDDFETLFPEEFARSGVTRCKLQMMRTAPQPDGWQLGPSLAAGLTLRFYPTFAVCPSLPRLRERIASESPEMDRWGIHALVSQTADGALTLGDSHEYGLAPEVFNKEEIDELILRYTGGFLRAPDLAIAQRWHGVYAKHPDKPYVLIDPEPGVRVVTAPGGSGMTLSFGLAEQVLRETGLIKV